MTLFTVPNYIYNSRKFAVVFESGFYTRKWMRLAVLNFAVVAVAGAVLRYKVSYALPQIDFKNLLHAHSHFAFAGWISTALFTLLISEFVASKIQQRPQYRLLFWLNQLTSYGMLFSFLIQEYGPVSISFSTANIFVSYAYAYMIWQHSKGAPATLSLRAMRYALVFLILSSLGPFGLAYITATHIFNGELIHNAIYWYLHFQYNGWFSFAVFALFLKHIEKNHPDIISRFRSPLTLMSVAAIPAYLLSIIWIDPPMWVYVVAGVSATLQLVAICVVVHQSRGQRIWQQASQTIRTLFVLSFASFSIKLVLQFLSVFPSLNQFVFGHRPVIIGYLHLVMLGFVSFFLIAYAILTGLLQMTKATRSGLWIFIIGVFLNELGLMMQGFSGILYTAFRWTPLLLFTASLTMLLGITILSLSQSKKNRTLPGV